MTEYKIVVDKSTVPVSTPSMRTWTCPRSAPLVETQATSVPLKLKVAVAPATLVTSVPAAAPTTGTVMAADLHQTDAKQIADLSRAVDLDRVQAAQQAATQAAAAVQSALINKVTSLTGGVKPLFDATNQVSSKALTTAITKMVATEETMAQGAMLMTLPPPTPS